MSGAEIELPPGWDVVSFDAVLESPQSLTYGIVQPGHADAAGVPIVRVKDIRNGRIDVDAPLRVAKAVEKDYARSRISGGELLVTLVGTVGECAVTPVAMQGWNTARAVAVAKFRTDVGASWVALNLARRQSRDLIAARVNTTVQTTLNLRDLRQMPIVLPPEAERRGIAAALGALDDKIDSNRHMVDTCNALCSALASQAMQSRNSALTQIADVVTFNPEPLPQKRSSDEIDYIDIASVSPGRVESVRRLSWSVAPSRAKRLVSDGDVIYSTVRPNRRSFSLLLDPTPETVVSTGFAVMRPSERCGSSLLTSIVSSASFAEYLVSAAHGSAYPAVGVEALGRYHVQLPPVVEAMRHEDRAMPIRRRAAMAESESRALQTLRDALLPELLSGRLRVPEAREVVADAVHG